MAIFPHPRRIEWDDLSDYVVHLTRDQGPMRGPEFSLVDILRGQIIEARNKFGIGRAFEHCPPVVCFTEAPLHQLRRVAERRSFYGFGFRKSFILASGGNPVFYAYGDRGDALAEIMLGAQHHADHPMWRTAAFIEQPQPGNAFEWEREWRVQHRLPFGSIHVQFITGPEDQHEDMRAHFDEEREANDFPNYRCPLIDLTWDADRIYGALGRRRPGAG